MPPCVSSQARRRAATASRAQTARLPARLAICRTRSRVNPKKTPADSKVWPARKSPANSRSRDVRRSSGRDSRCCTAWDSERRMGHVAASVCRAASQRPRQGPPHSRSAASTDRARAGQWCQSCSDGGRPSSCARARTAATRSSSCGSSRGVSPARLKATSQGPRWWRTVVTDGAPAWCCHRA